MRQINNPAPQPFINVDVEIYDKNEQAKLQKYRKYEKLEQLTSTVFRIPTAQFLTYYMFRRKRPGSPGYRTLGELSKKAWKAFVDLEDYVQWDGESISVPKVNCPIDRSVSERVGEAVALSIVNEIHGLTSADWGHVPEVPGEKTLDYEIASDGQGIIQVEAKGTSGTENFSKKSGSVYSQANSIRQKKSMADQNNYSAHINSQSEKYGVITSMKVGSPGELKAWVLDPVGVEIERSPNDVRLLNRMRYLLDVVSYIFPKAQFTAALATRMIDLETNSEPWDLDSTSLMRGPSRPFEDPTLFSTKSIFQNEKVVGHVMRLGENNLLFIGIQVDLLKITTRQDFQKICSYRAEISSDTLPVTCRVTAKKFEKLNLHKRVTGVAQENGQYFEFTLKGQMIQSSEGLVFGSLPLEQSQNTES